MLHKRFSGFFIILLLTLTVWIGRAYAVHYFFPNGTFLVNDVNDAVDINPRDGVCATATASCTLRAAIQEANGLPDAHTISLPAGLFTITIPGAGDFCCIIPPPSKTSISITQLQIT